MKLPMAEWLPDQPSIDSPGSANILNVLPIARGYRPFKDISVETGALTARCQGADGFRSVNDGTVVNFAGDVSKLYSLSSAAWSDVSVAGGYTVSAMDYWRFAQFGDRILASQIGDPVQYWDVGSSSAFADLAGSPPQAKHIAIVRDFVMLGNLYGAASDLAWSGFNNSEEWVAGTDQSDTQTLPDGGQVQAIIGGEAGYVYQERAIRRMTYAGPPTIFQIDVISENIGVRAPYSVARFGNVVYFLSHSGFYAHDLGSGQIIPIGTEKVDQWFSDNCRPDAITSVRAAVDPLRKIVYWSFASIAQSDATTPDYMLAYNVSLNRFTPINVTHELLFQGFSSGTTLEGIGALYATLEDVPGSLDNPTWVGGTIQLNGFSTAHKSGGFNGSTLAATMETSEGEPSPGSRAMVTNARPIVDTSSATITLRSRERAADMLTDSTAASMVSSGDVPLRTSGRYFRAQIGIPAGTAWTYGTEIEFDAVPDGMR